MKRENILQTPIGANNKEVANTSEQQLAKIKGTLTSQIRQRQEAKDPYFYAFAKLKGHGADLPVIFRIKEKNKPKLEKGNLVELTGYYSNSDKNIRKSFTFSQYQVLEQDKKIKKEE